MKTYTGNIIISYKGNQWEVIPMEMQEDKHSALHRISKSIQIAKKGYGDRADGWEVKGKLIEIVTGKYSR